MAYLRDCLPSRPEALCWISSATYMAVILAHGRERQENEEFKAPLDTWQVRGQPEIKCSLKRKKKMRNTRLVTISVTFSFLRFILTDVAQAGLFFLTEVAQASPDYSQTHSLLFLVFQILGSQTITNFRGLLRC